MIQRNAKAQWQGSLKDGQGLLDSDSEVLSETPYSFGTRFEDEPGTNPEELIAAAHAGCFSMALSGQLQEMNLTPEVIRTQASVRMDKTKSGFEIKGVHLQVTGVVPQASQDQFLKAAEAAKVGCPISKLLKTEISMEARLESDQAIRPKSHEGLEANY